MKVLVTGANGYIGTQLIPTLLDKGHEVICLVRDVEYFKKQFGFASQITLIKGDLLRERSLEPLPADIDAAYYLMHSMTQTSGFAGLEALSAQNFITLLDETDCRQIIFVNQLAHHSADPVISRQHIEDILAQAKAALTVIKTTMVLGAGSITVEMLKGLTEQANVVLAKRWAEVKVQPIALADLLYYLEAILRSGGTGYRSYQLGGPDVLTFKDLLTTYAEVTGKKIKVNSVPYILSQLSAHWINLLTPINYSLARNLIESLKNDAVCDDNWIKSIMPHECLSPREALQSTILTHTNV